MSTDKASHTPSPWTHGIRRDGSIWLSIGDHTANKGHYQGDLVATPADARLICAAPDMLAALKGAAQMIRLEVADPEDTGIYNAILQAIAKAEQ